jgi:hypothetical protein
MVYKCSEETLEKARLYREKNKEVIAKKDRDRYKNMTLEQKARKKETDRKYRLANREKKKIQEKAWRDANIDHVLARDKAYRERNKEKINTRMRNWSAENKEYKNQKRKEYEDEQSKKLTDYHIVHKVLNSKKYGFQHRRKVDEIPKELIEAKRLQLLIKRGLKNANSI